MNFKMAMLSDIGIKKKTNQDSCCVKEAKTHKGNVALSVICDGMGGLEKGEVASGTLIHAFSKWFEKDLPDILSLPQPIAEVQYQWDRLIKEQAVRPPLYSEEINNNLIDRVVPDITFMSDVLGIEMSVLQKDGNTDGADDDRQEAPVPERIIGYLFKNIAYAPHEDYHERINDIGRELPGIEHEHRHKSREHDQFPLGKIDDVRRPVDQDDAQRYERIDGAHGQAREKQLDIDRPIHIRPPSDWRYRPS